MEEQMEVRYYVPIQKGLDQALIFPVCDYYRGERRKFSGADGEEMVRHFKNNLLERDNGWLPINKEHERDKGRIAHIVDMWMTDNGPEAKIQPVPGYEEQIKLFD
jgi:hypothetical protein